MNERNPESHIELLITRHHMLSTVRESVLEAYRLMEACYVRDGKLLIAGNGGSAADAEHIAGELMKRFRRARPLTAEMQARLRAVDPVRGGMLARKLERGLMAIPLVAHEAMTTAYINDVDAHGVFAQQLLGFGRAGDVFLGISTSGNSSNVVNAAVAAKAVGMRVIGLTGADGGALRAFSDVCVCVPETETYRVQELHLPVYHCWCMMLEDRFFGPAD